MKGQIAGGTKGTTCSIKWFKKMGQITIHMYTSNRVMIYGTFHCITLGPTPSASKGANINPKSILSKAFPAFIDRSSTGDFLQLALFLSNDLLKP